MIIVFKKNEVVKLQIFENIWVYILSLYYDNYCQSFIILTDCKVNGCEFT